MCEPGARLLALDPAAGVAAFAGAQAAADALPVLARLRRLEVGEFELVGHALGVLDLHQVADLPQHARDHRVVVVLGGAADVAEAERAQGAAVARRSGRSSCAPASLSFATLRHGGLVDARPAPRRRLGAPLARGTAALADRLPARLRDVLGAAQVLQRRLTVPSAMLIGFVVPSTSRARRECRRARAPRGRRRRRSRRCLATPAAAARARRRTAERPRA